MEARFRHWIIIKKVIATFYHTILNCEKLWVLKSELQDKNSLFWLFILAIASLYLEFPIVSNLEGEQFDMFSALRAYVSQLLLFNSQLWVYITQLCERKSELWDKKS